MEERILIKSEQYNLKKVLSLIFCVFTIITFIAYLCLYITIITEFCNNTIEEIVAIILGVGISCLIGALCSSIVFWWLSKTEMIVSDKRVYGKTVFGKRVDLPLDSISAIGSKWPKGVAVATSSGRIAFLMVKNRDDIHKCVSGLLIDRQYKSTATTAIKQDIPQSNADELKKYKELLDSGIITQEEFDAKKKQLLGL